MNANAVPMLGLVAAQSLAHRSERNGRDKAAEKRHTRRVERRAWLADACDATLPHPDSLSWL